MCRISWCNKSDRFWKNGREKSLCSIHIQYKDICQNASKKNREYLMYKVEKWVKEEHQCELCGFDPVLTYPGEPIKAQSSTLDCDHIISDNKMIVEYENPSNFQLVCKNCHAIKNKREGDNVRKDYRKSL